MYHCLTWLEIVDLKMILFWNKTCAHKNSNVNGSNILWILISHYFLSGFLVWWVFSQLKMSLMSEFPSTIFLQEIRDIIATEGKKEDNENMDSLVVIIYGTPDGFDFSLIPEVLNNVNAPDLRGKPKLLYVIGNYDKNEYIYSTCCMMILL